MYTQSDIQQERCSRRYACVHPQTWLTFAQQRQSGVMSLGSEVCAVRTVEIKPGTAEQNVLKLINSTWLESQVPIYNNPPPQSSLLYLVCIPDSKHASIMMNTPNWDAPTGHQSGQENKHANTRHQITAQQRRDKTDTGKADGKVEASQHKNTRQNHNNQSPHRKQTRAVRYIKLLQKAQYGAERWCSAGKRCHPTTGFVYVVIY